MAHQYKTLRKEASQLKGMAEFQRWGSLPLVRVAKTQHLLHHSTSLTSLPHQKFLSHTEQWMDVLELMDSLQNAREYVTEEKHQRSSETHLPIHTLISRSRSIWILHTHKDTLYRQASKHSHWLQRMTEDKELCAACFASLTPLPMLSEEQTLMDPCYLKGTACTLDFETKVWKCKNKLKKKKNHTKISKYVLSQAPQTHTAYFLPAASLQLLLPKKQT